MIRLAKNGEQKPWTCDVCGKVAPWSDSWRHYGSLKFDEDCGHMVVTCSQRCRDSARAAELIAEWQRTHHYSCKEESHA